MAMLAICGLCAAEIPDDHPPWEPSDTRTRQRADLQRDPVLVEEFPLRPLGGRGATDAWELHPKALVGAGYDSDPAAGSGGSGPDLFARLVAGFEARLHPHTGWRLDTVGNLRHDQYLDTQGRDATGGDAAIAVRHSGELDTVSVEASWVRDSAAIPELPEQVERDRWRGALAAEGERRSWAWTAGLTWDRLDYLDDNPDFGRDERDRDRLRANAGWDLLGGGNSRLGVELIVDHERRPADSPANAHQAVAAQARWRTALATRSTIELRLGGGVWHYTDDSFQHPANNDRRRNDVLSSITFRWIRDLGGSLSVSASHQSGEAIITGSNGARQTLVEVSMRKDLASGVDAVAAAWWSRRSDYGAAPGAAPRSVIDSVARLGLEYSLGDGFGLRLWGSWQRSDDGGASDTRSMAAIELVAAL